MSGVYDRCRGWWRLERQTMSGPCVPHFPDTRVPIQRPPPLHVCRSGDPTRNTPLYIMVVGMASNLDVLSLRVDASSQQKAVCGIRLMGIPMRDRHLQLLRKLFNVVCGRVTRRPWSIAHRLLLYNWRCELGYRVCWSEFKLMKAGKGVCGSPFCS